MNVVPLGALADVVVLELPAGHAVEARAAVESCELVLGQGRCRAADEAGPVPTWRALLSWQDSLQLQARIEIQREDGAAILSVREVNFTQQDSLSQRYRALGLLVVSHLIEGRSSAKVEPPVHSAAAASTLPWGLDVAALAGPGLRSSGLRWGGLVRGWLNPFNSAVVPLASASWASASGAADSTWLEGAVGAALRLPVQSLPVTVEVRVEVVGQMVRLSAERDEQFERRWLSRYGLSSGLEGHVRLTPGFSIFAGVEGSLLTPQYVVQVQGEEQGGESAPTWSGLLGMRMWR